MLNDNRDIRDMIEDINSNIVSFVMSDNPDIIMIRKIYLDLIENFLKVYPLKDILLNSGNGDILRSLGFKEIILGDYDEYKRMIESFDRMLDIVNEMKLIAETYQIDTSGIKSTIMKQRNFYDTNYRMYLVPSIFSRFVYNTDGVTYYDVIKHDIVDSTRHAFDFRTTLEDHPGYSKYAVQFKDKQ